MQQARRLDQGGNTVEAVLIHDRLRVLAPGRRDLKEARLRAISRLGYDKVLELARKGHPYPAVELLRQLHASRPDEAGVAADLVTVLGWAGEAAELLKVVASLPQKQRAQEPILQAAARAHRDLRQYGKSLELYRDGRRRFPANPVYAVGEVRTLVDTGRPAEAAAAARGAIQSFPNDVELLMALAAAQEAERRPEDANATYDRVLALAPAHDEARRRQQTLAPQGAAYRRAIALARAGKAEQALPTLRTARTQAPKEMAIVHDLIVVLSWAGRHAEAIGEFEHLNSANVPPWVLREAAASYRATKRPDKAVVLYRRALAQAPEDLGLTMGLARALSESGQGKDALAVVRDQGIQHSRDQAALMLTAELHERHRDFDGARSAYERVLALAPKRVDARRGLRRVLPSTTAYTHAIAEARAGRTAEAEALLPQLRAADPGNATVTADLVAVLSWAGRHAEAVAAFATLPSANRAPNYAVEAAARSYRALHDHAEAALLYQQALQRAPQATPLTVALVATLLDAGRNEDVAPWLDPLLKREPRNAEVHALDGRRHEAAGAFDKAAAAYRRAAELAGDGTRRRDAESAALRMEYAALIRNAHDGGRAAALERLAQLHAERPDDLHVTADYAALLVADGRDEQALALGEGIGLDQAPDGLLDALAKANRNLGRPTQAAELYRAGWTRTAAVHPFGIGLANVLLDAREVDKAAAIVAELEARAPDDPEIRLARASVHEARKEYAAALAQYDRVLAVQPDRRDVHRRRVLAVAELGAPQQALRLAEAAPAGSVLAADNRRLRRWAAATHVRWADVPRSRVQTDYAEADRAITELERLIAEWMPLGAEAADDVREARWDRIAALRRRLRMVDAMAEFDTMVDEGAKPPPYALAAAADACLYLGKAERARELYAQVAERWPTAFEPRLSQLYAHAALGEWEQAFTLADQLTDKEGKWIWLKGLNDPLPNYDRLTADIAAAEIRLYAGDIDEAERRAERIAQEAPRNIQLRHLMGMIAQARHQPRKAITEFETALALEKANHDADASRPGAQEAVVPGRERYLEASLLQARLLLRDYPAAEAGTSDLLRRFPEQKQVQRLARQIEAHNKRELAVEANVGRSHGGDLRGNTYGLDSTLFSAPFANYWRVFAGYGVTSGRYPEGVATWHRASSGVEYRDPDIEAVAEVAANLAETDRIGGRLGVRTHFSDDLSAGISGELFSRLTPPRALANGITAHSAEAEVEWRPWKATEIVGIGRVLDFSDGNLRTELGVQGTQGIVSGPPASLDLRLTVTGSHNDQPGGPYFAPDKDLLGSVSAIVGQPLIEREDFSLSHRLIGTLGAYWQEDYGGTPVGGLRYEQELKLGEDFGLTYGAGIDWLSFDGQRETDASFNVKLKWKF